jgi:hypothetical protein
MIGVDITEQQTNTPIFSSDNNNRTDRKQSKKGYSKNNMQFYVLLMVKRTTLPCHLVLFEYLP